MQVEGLNARLSASGRAGRVSKELRQLQTASGKVEGNEEKEEDKTEEQAEYPGQKVQVDVKFVLQECVVNGQKYYKSTAVDECSRWM